MVRRLPLLLLTVLGIVGCTVLEDRLLYHPIRINDKAPSALPAPLEDIELHLPDGTSIHARWCPHPKTQGALLYCPGNAGSLEFRAQLVHQLWEALGESVLIFDYPGYGRSAGKPSEAGCYAAADAAYQWLVQNQRIPPERLILYGESLGGGVAVEQARRKPHRALVLARTFSSIPDVAQAQFSAAVRPLVTSQYDSIQRIGQCRRPVFIAQADRDRLIPFAHGEALYAACGGAAEFYCLRGLDHNDPLPADFYARLRDFLQTRAPVSPLQR